ncbi:MAG: efflux RND transporter periplasmic adaptor subunit [Pararhizobium sp.]
MTPKLNVKQLFVFALLLPLLAACSEGKSADEKSAPPQMPPPAVSFVNVEPQSLPIVNNLPGRIAPTRIAEVRPRVSGIVIKRVFTQGTVVKQGDVLYEIDPQPFEVQVASAQATLAKAKAAQLQARQNEQRQKKLSAQHVASEQTYQDAVAQLAQADADVAAAEANLKSAQLNLQYSKVRAPISGRIGRAQITEGALVTANDTQALATIQQLDPVYADFTQSANELMQLRRALKVGSLSDPNKAETSVRLQFDDGTDYMHPGRLLFSEASVDSTTGQITLRGEFPNPEGYLLPGMYVRVLIEQGIENNALVVPQQAVQRTQEGDAQVYVIKDDDTVELRTVSLGRVVNNEWVVTKGLKGGEKVVVEGFQKIKPGAKVVPEAWKQSHEEAALKASNTKDAK